VTKQQRARHREAVNRYHTWKGFAAREARFFGWLAGARAHCFVVFRREDLVALRLP